MDGIKLNWSMNMNGKQRIKSRDMIIGVNLALLGTVGAMVIVGFAGAQPNQPRRVSGQYIAVGGETVAGYTNVVYVLDSVNRELVAMQWNESTKQLDGVGYRDLVSDTSKENGR